MADSNLPRRDHAVLAIIDVQARLVPAMAEFGPTLVNIRRLTRGAKALALPILVTEQYPRGLGPTVPSVARLVPGPYPAKTAFSCFGCEPFAQAAEAHDELILCGIEAHVCVLQTALGGLARGKRVFVAADAVTSRAVANRQAALAELAAAGVVIAPTETLLFGLLGAAGSPEFKAISRLVK
ncbi:MAG: isochorismatase family protein [Armatimonadetes bacterium]|nr:isochorismatase family protein [Armatimonadota bacterium]